MTPLKDSRLSNSTSAMSDELLSDGDTTVMMEDSSIISSPPRSCLSKPSSRATTLHGNLLFQPSQDDPVSATLGEMSATNDPTEGSPKSRRLFDDETLSDHEESMMQDSVHNSSYQHANGNHHRHQGNSSSRRLMLKPLDLNNDLTSEAASMASLSLSSGSRAVRLSNETQQAAGNAQHGRKRSSAERRSEESPRTPYRSQSNNLFGTSTAAAADSSVMNTSPHISPNSFITMDGRFVQSNNPFSSPMMDEESLTPRRTQQQQQYNSSHPAPSFPVPFPLTEDDGKQKAQHLLPPRSRPLASHSPLNGGFPDQRFSFTGSPIAEVAREATNHRDMMDMEETETASSGSLHKVRRLTREDDVVAATGQHIRLKSCYQRRPGTLSVDTCAQKTTDCGDDDISPTDVVNFPPPPVAPPTPIKARRAPVHPPYARIQRQDPMTPARSSNAGARNRQLQRTMAARTPHPQRHAASRDTDMETTTDSSAPSKSRFYGDFDIIGELGKGSFGTVYQVLSRLDGCMYAIKAAHRKAKGQADRDRMLKEVYALAALSDQADTATFHIVRYHQAWMEDDRLYIQTELCTGTLVDEIQRDGCLSEPRCYKLLREILLALDFIHRNHMVHLDIKPDNVFTKNGLFKLGDFGLVTKASACRDVEEGDSRYMSMELLSGDSTDLTKSDIFSLGATMYEICLGRPLPMNGPEWQDLRAGRLAALPGTSPDLASLIQQMMSPIAEDRPSASELLKHRQLLSEEQKALIEERSKVAVANMQLMAQAQQFQRTGPPPRKGLVRANTWNGSSMLKYL